MSTPRAASILPLLAALVALGCASTEVVRLDPGHHPARPVETLTVLDALPPTGTYTALARIEVRDGGWRQSPARLRERLRQKAAALGATAVVLELPGSHSTFGGAPPLVMARYDERTLVGTAIVELTPAAPTTPSEPR